MNKTIQTEDIKGRQFAEPLYVDGGITSEPERYLAEKPYELSKFEFSVIKKGKYKINTWFQLVSGATAGFILSIIGKALNALIQKQTPTTESWELWAVGVGILLAVLLRKQSKTDEEKEFEETKEYIHQHFESTCRRRIHVAGRGEGQK